MLQKVKFAPGFNKQVTATGGESQWVNGDNVRFRYGTPEKIGGWAQLGSVDVTGRNTAIHHFINTAGIKYAALGTNRLLYVYSGGVFYDISPIKSTTTLSNAFSTTNGSAIVTLTFASAHNIGAGDIILLDNFSSITNSNYSSSNFDALESQEKVFPLNTEASNTLPKLSKVHKPGSVITSPDAAAFHAKKLDASVTVAPDECEAAVVPEAPLVKPDKVPPLLPV